MHILLHIGQSKTGTSAIQAYLTLNRLRLREAGIFYPSVTIGGMSVDIGSHNAVADAVAGVLRYPKLTADQYFNRFFSEAKRIGTQRMILSAEHFFGGEPRVWDVASEKIYFDGYRRKVNAVARYLAGHEVTLLVYLRPQIEWLASAISQTVRTEKLISTDRFIYRDDHQFFEMSKPLLRYYQLIDIWNNCIRPRQMMVIPYERKNLHKKSAIADFLYRTGLENLDFPFGAEGLQVNQSLSREYIEVKKILNRTPRSKIAERVTITCLERLSARSGYNAPYRLSDELSREIARFVASENDQLNERYIQGITQLGAQSATHRSSENKLLGEEDIAQAFAAFEREYTSLSARLLTIDYGIRAFLRMYAKPLHSALHQLKRLYRSRIYRK